MKFANKNAVAWYLWIFRRGDELPAVTIYFLSRVNGTSPRFFPLYERTQNLRIIVFRGLPIPKTDRLMLAVLNVFILFFARRLSSYRFFVDHGFRFANRVATSQVMQLDDPTYSCSEIEGLQKKHEYLCNLRKTLSIVVTSEDIASTLMTKGIQAKISVIEQGFTKVQLSVEKHSKFSIAYTSNYIHYYGDKHALHSGWGATNLIENIIPRVLNVIPNTEIHLFGNLGANAERALGDFQQVIIHGFLTPDEHSRELSRCHLGIYPRKIDNGWRVQKVYEYIGAGLPIVTYRSSDTKTVEELNIGISVSTDEEFINAIRELSVDNKLYSALTARLKACSEFFTWERQSKKLDSLFI